MTKIKHPRGGHFPGHLRNAFLQAIEIWYSSDDANPTVVFEDDYRERQITMAEACGIMWNCRDILPDSYGRDIEDGTRKPFNHDMNDHRRWTYAAAARAIKATIAQA